jgi:hypothetical protein
MTSSTFGPNLIFLLLLGLSLSLSLSLYLSLTCCRQEKGEGVFGCEESKGKGAGDEKKIKIKN